MNTLIKTFGKQKRWVNWVKEVREGKTTKVPLGKSNDPKTWSKLEDLPDQDNIGLMFGIKKMLLGIDIDKCLVDGELKSATIQNLLSLANTYCEISPSGTGLHLFLNLTDPLQLLANRKDGFECYTSERFFTVTKNPFQEEKDVRTVTPTEAEDILTIIGYPWKKEPVSSTPRPAVVSSLSDEELLKKMFNAKNGETLKALYSGETAKDGDVSVEDLKLCSMLAFWTQGDAEQIERLWMASPLGSREKTQDRKDYRDRTIKEAISGCKEFYKPRQSKKVVGKDGEEVAFNEDDMGLHFSLTKEGIKKYSLIQENINVLLQKHPHFNGRFRYDEFKIGSEVQFNGVWHTQKDVHEMYIQSEISNIFPAFNRVSPMMVERAMRKVGADNTVDCAKEYILSLRWDGLSRADTWLQTVFGVEDDEYTRRVGSNWLKGLVHRLIQPGCQFDYVLVVEGQQGLRKSSAFRELVSSSWHLETERSPGEKDFFVEMAGKAVIELSEGQSNATIDVKKMKSILTKRKDTYRSPYGKIAEDHPRRSVFCMTTNDEDYLKDTTGDRRWWPVTCTKMADIQWIIENRDQLFAEAYYRLSVLKETTYEVPEDVAKERQEDRRRKEPNTDIITDWYRKTKLWERQRGITVHEAFIGAFYPEGAPLNISMTRPQEMEIASVLKTTIKLKKRRDGTADRKYRYFDDSLPVITDEEAKTLAQNPVGSPIEFYKSLDEIE